MKKVILILILSMLVLSCSDPVDSIFYEITISKNGEDGIKIIADKNLEIKKQELFGETYDCPSIVTNSYEILFLTKSKLSNINNIMFIINMKNGQSLNDIDFFKKLELANKNSENSGLTKKYTFNNKEIILIDKTNVYIGAIKY